MQICESMDIMDKLAILTDAAKYDVACTSSGTETVSYTHLTLPTTPYV